MLAAATQTNRIELPRYKAVDAIIEDLRPATPIYALFPDRFRTAARAFIDGFPGETLYAVKANHALPVLDQVYASGIRHFDVASLAEVRLIRERFPAAKQSFMAPVRLRDAAAEAYAHGVRSFALDGEEELAAILRETGGAKDRRIARELTLYVRLAVPLDSALLELSSKFGVGTEAAADLLQRIADAGAKPALTFHVGSQCLHPEAYAVALGMCGQALKKSAVDICALDVGGGFPGSYLKVSVPPMADYFAAVKRGIETLDLPRDCAIYCEPGRALVAQGMSVITQVTLRRDATLYINDGIYGSLNEYALNNWPVRYPLRVFSTTPQGGIAEKSGPIVDFRAYGPTCDSLDVLPVPLELPSSIASGDWIEFQQMGAYSCALRTSFNGFYPDSFVVVG